VIGSHNCFVANFAVSQFSLTMLTLQAKSVCAQRMAVSATCRRRAVAKILLASICQKFLKRRDGASSYFKQCMMPNRNEHYKEWKKGFISAVFYMHDGRHTT